MHIKLLCGKEEFEMFRLLFFFCVCIKISLAVWLFICIAIRVFYGAYIIGVQKQSGNCHMS